MTAHSDDAGPPAWREYGLDLEANLRDLLARVQRGAYRASPTRRLYIPKPDGIERRRVRWVLDADIRDFFSRLDQGWLGRFLEHRIADRRPERPERTAKSGKRRGSGSVTEEP